MQVFDKNSIENNNEAVVWNDTLLDSQGLGEQSVSTKNKIEIIGDDGTGLPVLATANNSDSQTLLGIKELPVFDTKVKDIDTANELATSTLSDQSVIDTEGDVQARILPSLNPGEKIWISDPVNKILNQFRVYSLTHKLPEERTILVINKSRGIKELFKKRVENELASQTITNPFNMSNSINLTFDNASELSTMDDNVQVIDGIVSLSSGTQGRFTLSTTTLIDMSEVQLKVAGSKVIGTNFEISTDGGANYTVLIIDSRTILSPGDNIILRVTLQSADTEIDSLALLYK